MRIEKFYYAHFIFGKSIQKQQTMVELQLAENAIAKNRSQIKPKPVKGLSFLWRAHQGAGASLSHTRGMWRRLFCFPREKSTQRRYGQCSR